MYAPCCIRPWSLVWLLGFVVRKWSSPALVPVERGRDGNFGFFVVWGEVGQTAGCRVDFVNSQVVPDV